MDKDRIEGAAKQALGSVKEAFGKLTGDARTQAEGTAQKTEGKVQTAAGSAKDILREAAGKQG
ncbi:MAG: CsbD family protein [Acetobacteraceae bacterium]|nr:MAG: CsbD family protein [Acetobacteraceae bacterium]